MREICLISYTITQLIVDDIYIREALLHYELYGILATNMTSIASDKEWIEKSNMFDVLQGNPTIMTVNNIRDPADDG